ncbi:MAG: ABC transporter ATP-binding protein/permease [Alphaproteobacteria bacterium]|nr:ABC transporter ATP-binding protein/permease [Alphaproteobacteria bacterium]MBU0795756.1 ABC transporter ATP-binding protein/permease [Alphaproteobacteria bacterium]MBU0887379.1 ABC transporter ATP-binding protein/permease [Alphaproteobacteria bacterium]MBU1811740.1 ABC transporter ATP-binding protein/permease [Alphaproteobacteria bacterium]
MTRAHGASPTTRTGSDLKADGRAIRALLPYLWPKNQPEMRSRVVIAMVFLVIAKIATVIIPYVYKLAIDALTGPDLALIVVPVGLLVLYGVVRIASSGFNELRDFVFARVAQRAIRNVALKTFEHLHALALRFHLDRQTGGLSRVIERGTKGIEFLLSFMLFNIVPTLLEILLVCGILWVLYDFWYSAVTFLTIVGYIAFTLSITEWRIQFRRAMNDSDQEANTKAIDSLLNYETVKYFGNEAHEARRFDEALKRYENAAVKSRTTLSLLNVGQGAIIAVGLVAVMVMAGFGVKNGTMTIGDFVLVNGYLIQLYLPLNFLGFVYREMKQSLIDMEAMFRLLAVDREVKDRDDAVSLTTENATVEFRDVRFGYRPDRPILKGVAFKVPAGKTVAIVGPSGAGKSTISRLLFRFYDVDSGSIRIDGHDIRELSQTSLRAAIGIVPQDTVLFNDTIYYNIAYGRPGASPAEVEQAARLAQVHDFVLALPDGYTTRVGERGLKLSGGEKQRVAIARTILKRPAILLFDEATSALDTHTEREIQHSLREVSRGRTTLVIAHRLSTVVDADEIIVLQDGEIVERGPHRELIERDGIYAAMWRRQQEGFDLERGTPAGLEDIALADSTPQ